MNTPFIIAEVSANHLGSLERAKALVMAAADVGADAVKFQCWTPDTMCIDPNYTIHGGTWKGQNLMQLYREAYTPWEWFEELFELADSLGLVAFASVFDKAALAFLESICCPLYKISSFEITDLPLIRAVSSTGKPVIISTGMANLEEIHDAWEASGGGEGRDVALLKCTSAYPSSPEDANLATIQTMKQTFGPAVGVSDHTLGITVPVVAVALGATIVEKHLTLLRADGGPDAAFSLEPHEFKQMVVACREAAAAIGEVRYGPTEFESTALRRSLYVTKDLEPGDVLSSYDNFQSARPALGAHPGRSSYFQGKFVGVKVAAGTPLTDDLL